ncbi:TonB-dependent receptor [Acinetobacter sp. GFQ9D192M]|uniref:TonB-dependent receptor n=1 Tax=Acinetobacter variabilis TaxID=70346 RepID=A0A7T7WK87_9GAMM|nr:MULTISPECIES: TonB-dependent receptor [Acinetobacter]NHB63871.1 TonB-dependent receptor [Acinetobacter sp. GFQ9D191M]NHC00213.1 TonB-dependent receptor [Acinetobacter sp. GFQ9D192M]QQN88666.1 TonB-dependent receptor [Acinetobacter variabilis]
MKKNKLVGSMGAPTVSKRLLKLSALSLSMMCLPLAHAEEAASAEQPTKVQKVTVTGSSIKGVAAQSSSPITVIKGEDLANQGVTTVEEALVKVSANQAGFSTAQNVGASNTSGSTANLRGLGSDKTLVLLNGRRLAYSAFSTDSTNLNIIPMAMIDRIEILRDGASAVYGADAIAGVINFITKSEYNGLGVTGALHETEHSGGEKQQAAIFGGFGDLDENGFNVMGVLDYRKSNQIHAQQRKVSRRGGVIPELGIDAGSASGFPANIYDPTSGYLGNPYPDDCNNIPWSSPDDGFCYLNTQALIAIKPQVETLSALGKGTFKLNDSLNAVGEYVFTRSEVSTSIAPDVYGRTVTLPSSSQYYPGNGITPAITDGELSGDPLQLYLRSQAGNRQSMSTNDSHRFFAGIEGEALGWDINAGVSYAKSEATDEFTGGYLHRSNLQTALNEGRINPFGPARPGDTPWESFVINGETNIASLESTTADFTISRPIFELPAGDVGFAFGGSFTTQDWEAKVNSEIVAQVPGSGIDPSKPISKGDRDITAFFTEFQIPILPSLEAQIAARYDDYSDFGDTFNPKVGLRWEPMKEVMFRASYSTGFRAPSLYEINAPISETWTGAKYNDPVLCPGGTPVEPKYQVECNTQFKRTQGGSPDLQPEESTSFTAGLVFEPIKNLVFTADYFNIEIDGLVGTVGESSIFGNPDLYADRFIRDSEGRIQHIRTTLMNSGGLKTSGVDLSLNYLTPKTSTGRFGFGIDGTYVINLDYQSEPGGEWSGLVGKYEDPAVVRWKHVANLNWSYEDWKMIFEQQFTRGYEDYSGERDVGDYTLYNFATTYKGFKNLELTGGILNIFDEEPAASDVLDNFQYGYDPRYSDPTGRTYYIRGTYKF